MKYAAFVILGLLLIAVVVLTIVFLIPGNSSYIEITIPSVTVSSLSDSKGEALGTRSSSLSDSKEQDITSYIHIYEKLKQTFKIS